MISEDLYVPGQKKINKKHGQRFSLPLRIPVDLREGMLPHAVPKGGKLCRLLTASRPIPTACQLL